MYFCVYVNTRIHINVYMYIKVHMCMCRETLSSICMYVHTQAYIYIYIYICVYIYKYIYMDLQCFSGGSDSKESACSVGDLGSIPGLGRCPGGGHGIPLQYSCLDNPHG